VEPTAIPADATPPYTVQRRADGATCIQVGALWACDVRYELDEQTQRWYALEIAAGRMGEAVPVEAAPYVPPAPVCVHLVIERDGVPIGETVQCAATQAEADALAQAEAERLRGQP
jgi:hypothetical protein